jgi:hypothetical protein
MTLDLPAPVAGPGRNACAYVRHIQQHPEDEAKLLAALRNPAWGPKPLAVELTSRGIATSEAAIRRHRRGECTICNEKGYTYDAR